MNFRALKPFWKLWPLCIPFGLYVLISWWLLGKPQLCLFRALCGLPCPGCGLTHAFWYLIQGRIIDSLESHLLFLPVLVTLIAAVLPPEFSPLIARFHRQVWWYVLLGTAMTVYFIVRLLMTYPGDYPMCYEPENLLHLMGLY